MRGSPATAVGLSSTCRGDEGPSPRRPPRGPYFRRGMATKRGGCGGAGGRPKRSNFAPEPPPRRARPRFQGRAALPRSNVSPVDRASYHVVDRHKRGGALLRRNRLGGVVSVSILFRCCCRGLRAVTWRPFLGRSGSYFCSGGGFGNLLGLGYRRRRPCPFGNSLSRPFWSLC